MSGGKNWTVATVTSLAIDEDAVLQNNAHMPQNDAAFCVWVLQQLYNTERDHMVEPFFIVGQNLPDMRTLYRRLENGSFADAAEFETELFSIPTTYLGRHPGQHTRVHEKANALLLDLPKRFKGRNAWKNRRRRSSQQQSQQQQQQQAPTVPSTPASAAAPLVVPAAAAQVAPTAAATLAAIATAALSHSVASEAAVDATPGAHQQSRFSTPLVVRSSATPGPSARPTPFFREGATNPRAPERSAHRDPDSTSRQDIETVDYDSALNQARLGKKRATSHEDIGRPPKRARQEADKYKYKYRNLRLQIAGVIDREMRLIHQQKSSMQLEAGAQRYIDYLSQMDVEAIQEAKTADLNEFKEDNIEWLERSILDHVHDELNKFLAKKGQFIQPRVLLSIEHKHEDEAEDDGDSESDSKPRVKREQS